PWQRWISYRRIQVCFSVQKIHQLSRRPPPTWTWTTFALCGVPARVTLTVYSLPIPFSAARRARTPAASLSPRGGRTMLHRTRRDFLKDVGKGMVVASVGSSLAADLGLGAAFAQQGPETLGFGELEPLVCLMQETSAAQLQSVLVQRLRQGTE